jgi:hypothetical protein
MVFLETRLNRGTRGIEGLEGLGSTGGNDCSGRLTGLGGTGLIVDISREMR